MIECERHIKCVVAGDPLTSPDKLVQCMSLEWQRQDVMISNESPCSFSLKILKNLNQVMVVHLSFQILTSPPQTLVTGSDVLLLVFSPAHPLSFLHIWKIWWPLFSHLRQLPYLIVANNMELLVNPKVQQYLNKNNIQPISFEEVMEMLQAANVTYNNFFPVSRIHMKDLLLQDPCSTLNTSLKILCNELIRTSCSLSVDVEQLPLQSRWDMALEEALSQQLMSQLLDEWVVVTSPLSNHVFYANRKTREVTTVKPVELSNSTIVTSRKEEICTTSLVPQENQQKEILESNLAKTLLPKEYLRNLEEAVETLREKRSQLQNIEDHVQHLRKAVPDLRQEILVLQSRINNLENDNVSIMSKQETLQKEFHSLQEQCDQLGTINELTLSTLSEEIDVLRRRYLNIWQKNRKSREKLVGLKEKVHDAQERVKLQQYQLQKEVESKISLLHSRFVAHYNEIDELEQKCLLLHRWRAIRGHKKFLPLDNNTKYTTNPTYILQEWFSFLQGLSQALISTVEPLLSASEKLRVFYKTDLVYRNSSLRRVATLKQKLHHMEMLQRRRIAVEETLEFVSCILDDFLLPVQRRGRCLGQRVAALLQLLP